MKPAAYIGLCGSVGLFLGFPNPIVHLPALALAYPAALALLGESAPRPLCALRRGWLTGLVGASAAMYWVAIPVNEVGGLPWVLAVPCVLAMGAYVGLYGGYFAMLAHRLRAYSPLVRCCALALCWLVLEHLRAFLFTGFPWLTLASAFVPWIPVIQAAAVFGAYGLSGILAGTACLLVQGSNSKSCLCCGLLLALALPLGGLLRLSSLPGTDDPLPSHALRMALVQGNIDQNQKWLPAYQRATLEHYLQISAKAAADGHLDLTIWPETAMPFFIQDHPEYAAQLRAFANRHAVPLLLGAPAHDNAPPKTRRVFNRAFLLGDEGQDLGTYDKAHLVPFGEYLPPWLDYPALTVFFQGVGNFTPGVSDRPLRLKELALGVLICYETVFPEIAQASVAAGAGLLLNISNDAWFGLTSAPEQHLHLSVLRAVEQGRWLIRATNTGISAFVDPTGRIRARSGLMRTETLIGAAVPEQARTPFHHVFPWLTPLALMILACLLRLCPKDARPSTKTM
ncbi:MAG: apolipoprotein N-acyltransferase [Deltaproteobacteria bacterium]|jgi:apolipoprotein N-acyltransferase|nr:apolipoprotein N-acyltransferase [Deltaproteobacteria bacterium]